MTTTSSVATPSTGATPLPAARWDVLARAHRDRARALTAAARDRRSRGETHPVEDFLWDYYALRPGRLERWEPGLGTGLVEPVAAPGDAPDPDLRTEWVRRAGRRWQCTTGRPGRRVTQLDASAYVADRGAGITAMDRILRATAARPAHLGCLGLHEWAMVYTGGEARDERRHPLPLRLGREGTDAVVESSTLRCTHVDAYRFFTPAAAPRNRLRPTRETQADLEQPGCLHANMDLLAWSVKLGPAVPGELLLDCFELARDVRVLDMEASPYDCRELGYGVVPIETAEGRAQYIARQSAFATRAAPLRRRLAGITAALLDAGSSRRGSPGQGATAPST